KALDETLISQGLLPRFTTIEYYGKRPKPNFNHAKVMPDETLRQDLVNLIALCLEYNSQHNVIDVQFTPDATKMCDDFNEYCDSQMPEPARDIFDQIWSRAHVKVLKHAGLIAVGCDWLKPVADVSAV